MKRKKRIRSEAASASDQLLADLAALRAYHNSTEYQAYVKHVREIEEAKAATLRNSLPDAINRVLERLCPMQKD